MNTNLKRFFSLSVIDTEYLNDKQDKFEFVKCPKIELNCKEQLSLINKIYIDSEFYRREKDYKSSVEILKNAFFISTELTEVPCTKCASVFRTTIIESLENIQKELNNITNGIFGNKKYKSSLELTETILNELKSYKLHDNFQINRNPDKRFIENNSNRKVS